MMHFVRTFLIYACLRRKDDCYQIGYEIMEKLYSSKTALKEYGGGMHHSTQR